jgi:hypothetical protein
MFHIRLSSDKPVPKPYYYDRMNMEELEVWTIIVSIPSPSSSSSNNVPLTPYRAKQNTSGSAIAKAGYTSAVSATKNERNCSECSTILAWAMVSAAMTGPGSSFLIDGHLVGSASIFSYRQAMIFPLE